MSSDSTPPTLPPRPGYKQVHKAVPVQEVHPLEEPDAVYDDCGDEPIPEYDDCGKDDIPPPLPPHPEDFYDDVGPIVQHIPKRQLPPPPDHSSPAQVNINPGESIYELGDGDEPPPSPQSQSPLPPPPPVMEDPRDVYEVEPDVAAPSPPPHPTSAPSLPPKGPGAPKLPPHHPPKPVTSPGGPKEGKSSTSGFAMGLGQLQNAKAGLRRVSLDQGDGGPPPTAAASSSSHDPKVYDACPDTVYEAKKLFQGKAEGKPEILSPKPQLGGSKAPKPKTFTVVGSSSDPGGQASQAPPARPSVAKVSNVGSVGPVKQSTFDKAHGSAPPVPSAPIPQKPVTKTPPTVEVFDEPEDIYDDAASYVPDPLACYDWYHGNIPREQGERRVNTVGKDGAFLVRVSLKDPKFPFTLVVLHNKQVNNLRIRRRQDGKVALGDEKTGEVAFEGVPKMIDHHRQHVVVLLGSNQTQVKLQHIAAKS
ncbi:hypothetical protein ACOMHN_007071 [Nucella lapillus]